MPTLNFYRCGIIDPILMLPPEEFAPLLLQLSRLSREELSLFCHSPVFPINKRFSREVTAIHRAICS
ncbi:hypothetical protein C7B64_00645 [Merismopedia glauca CCAP 1448/3]|uniref:Uncharacterized protein n=1 Tax=Merismopedia glauca CCAP 1448/3 TaxID=1296344 RepID=A0A2T1CAL4_9CYAN|nr:hypothetical protein C7B64_00645 [Merismopedia glauca CCAP 1448/3]